MEFKYIEIEAVLASGEIRMIKERFNYDSNSEQEVLKLLNNKFVYSENGDWINTNLIERFSYKAFVKKENKKLILS